MGHTFWKQCDIQIRSNGCHCMGRSTSASYHHVHLPDDLTQLDHSEAVHAVWKRTEVLSLDEAARTLLPQLKAHEGKYIVFLEPQVIEGTTWSSWSTRWSSGADCSWLTRPAGHRWGRSL